MSKFVSSISGLPISAASAAYAPTNGADVSAVASAYAESAASGKLDSTASSQFITSTADLATTAYVDSSVSSKLDTTAFSTVSSNFLTSQTVTALGDDGTYITSINGSGISGVGGGGATGDYVETSATEVTIGSGNSASATSFAQGKFNSASGVSFAQGISNTAALNSFAQGVSNTASGRSFALGGTTRATVNSFALGEYNTASSNSFAQGQYNTASSNSFAQGNANTAYDHSFAQGVGNSATNIAAAFGSYNLHGNGDISTGDAAAFVIGDGENNVNRHDLMLVTKDGEITMFSSTSDTAGTGIMSSIRAISAAATGGGVDSATVSSIASSYAESAASSKLDSSASSSFYTTANESGYVGSAYVDSAVSGKMDTSAMTSYALSSDVSGTVDLVSTQSANWSTNADWAESASSSPAYIENKPDLVDIVAGPGIVVDNPDGNTLRVSMIDTETVLYDGGTSGTLDDITLSEDFTNFQTIKIYFSGSAAYTAGTYYVGGHWMSFESADLLGVGKFKIFDITNNGTNDSTIVYKIQVFTVNSDKLHFNVASKTQLYFNGSTWAVSTTNGSRVYKVVGVHRIANN